MSWTTERAEHQAFARSVDPAVILTTKDAWPWKAIAWLLYLGTFTAIKRHKFLAQFATTIGPIQGYPKEWQTLNRSTIVHEAQHTKQAKWFGWLVPIVGWLPGRVGHTLRALAGLPFMLLFYVLLPLPLGLAVGRWLFEVNAERAAYRYRAGKGEQLAALLYRARTFGSKVCGAAYGWSWPRWFGGVRAFERAARRAYAKHGKL